LHRLCGNMGLKSIFRVWQRHEFEHRFTPLKPMGTLKILGMTCAVRL
jgi:hypothetical protein